MPAYTSIKESVLRKLETHLPEIRERFGIETLGVFGSVSRGEDTEDSDIDILYKFRTGELSLANLVNLGDYLEELFGRRVDLVAERALSPYIRSEVIAGAIMIPHDCLYLSHIRDEIVFLNEITDGLTYENLNSDKRTQHIV